MTPPENLAAHADELASILAAALAGAVASADQARVLLAVAIGSADAVLCRALPAVDPWAWRPFLTAIGERSLARIAELGAAGCPQN